jgi:hypothetical protein
MIEYEQGDPVLVFAPAFYRNKRLGIVYGPCKDHDGAIRILMIDPNAPIKEICADVSKGDTIERLNTINPLDS